jgi:outer membrane receptor for ferrienterochelin and colicins
MRRLFLSIGLICCTTLFSQTVPTSDTGKSVWMRELIVTATRSERRLGNLAVPVTVVSGKSIRQSGSLRLNDILGEQTGLFITEGFGRGVQMQGLSPDYTLILLDGEPLIGRMGGVLDLSRIAVGNIRKIEIVKGPSSSLYGSEALAGVVNIITDRTESRRFGTDLRYGRFNTMDASVDGATRMGRLSLNAFANLNATEGYSLLPNSLQKTVEPFRRATQQVNAAYRIDDKTRFSLGFRNHLEDIRNTIVVQNLGTSLLSRGSEVNRDLNLTPVITHTINERVRTTLRGYLSRFSSEQVLDVNDAAAAGNYNDRFRQTFARIENQTDIEFHENANLTLGGGFLRESVRSNRYDSQETRRTNPVGYLFVQQEWRPIDRISLIGGLRFDHNGNYASVLSPKLALQYRFGERLRLNASVGRGFKAPDFRQLYLNFTNVAAGGYTVFGALVAADEVEMLKAAGQIEQVLPSFSALADLKPETSTGLNLGLHFQPSDKWSFRSNLFRNDISNLILTDIIAYKTGGGQIFSYLNISRVFTQGSETEVSWRASPTLTLSGGYQYLVTADKDVLERISAGQVFKRDGTTGLPSRMARSDYAGLPGRSKHMANLKVLLESADARWFSTLRLIYRSRWGTSDLDGNGLINRPDEFAKGFLQLNLSAGRSFGKGFRVMAGIDNVLDHRDPLNLPGLPGINPYLSVSFRPKETSNPVNKPIKKQR